MCPNAVLDPSTCALCAESAARHAATGDPYVCDACGTVHAALDFRWPDDPREGRTSIVQAASPLVAEVRPAARAGSPVHEQLANEAVDRAINNLLRWLPDLSPRSGPLVRDGVRVSTSATALDGRTDRVDGQSRQVAAAVRTWRRLRAMIAAGEGAEVAVLWAAHAGVVEQHDAEGHRLGGPTQRTLQVTAVALGCASGALRREWKLVAAERPRVVAYTSSVRPAGVAPVPTMGKVSERHEVAEGMQDRERRILHIEQQGAQGPSVEAQAVAWGAERLADLWAPGAVSPAEARRFALGFASGEERARWERLKVPSVRDAEVCARGEALLRAAEERWYAR